MLNGGSFDEARRRTLKLTLDAVVYSLLSFLSGFALLSVKNATILFTDIAIPSDLLQVFAMVYFLFFIVFSASLLIPMLIDFIGQVIEWAASSVLWHIAAAMPFYLTVAFTLNCIIQGAVTLPATIFSLPVEHIAGGWLAYVALVMIVDAIKPDWREGLAGLFGGASSGSSDYLTRQLESRHDAPAPAAYKSEGDMRDNYLGGGGEINWAFLLTGVFAVLVAGAFGYYYWDTSKTIAARELTIAQQTAQVAQLNTQIEGLQTELTAEKENSISLLTQLNANATTLTLTTAQLTAKTNELNASKSSLQTQLTTLEAEKAALVTNNTELSTQVSNLTGIVNLSKSTTQVTPGSFTQASNALSTVSSFTANYAGYLAISGTHTATSGYIRVTDSHSYYPTDWNSKQYTLTSSGTIYVPVLPGSITVSFGNTGGPDNLTANISVVYYY